MATDTCTLKVSACQVSIRLSILNISLVAVAQSDRLYYLVLCFPFFTPFQILS